MAKKLKDTTKKTTKKQSKQRKKSTKKNVDKKNNDKKLKKTKTVKNVDSSKNQKTKTKSDIVNEKKYRCFGFSCKTEFLDEDTIKLALKHKSIKGCAYILHDSDVISQDDIDDEMNDYNEKDLNQPKDDHWHIVLEVNPGLPISTIAKWFCIADNIVEKRLGMGAFRDYLAYMTHITKNSLNKKWEYDPEEVKGLKFPDKAWCLDLKNYNDFKDAYIDHLLNDLGSYEKKILSGELTPLDVMEKAPQYYIDHMNKIDLVYRKYCNNLRVPDYRWNYYVHGKGGTGKDITSLVLAISILQTKHPDVNFSEMSKDDLTDRGYIYWAGNGSSTLQDYLGHEIIIWSDIRAATLIKTFGNTGNCFRALDLFPSTSKVKILYGNVKLVNEINIFNGIETYDEFIENLSINWQRYKQEDGSLDTKMFYSEDDNQARRRFPFIIEVTTSLISLQTELKWLSDGFKPNPYDKAKLTVKNDMKLLAQHGKLADKANNFAIADFCKDASDYIIENESKSKIPNKLFEIIPEDEAEQIRQLEASGATNIEIESVVDVDVDVNNVDEKKGDK